MPRRIGRLIIDISVMHDTLAVIPAQAGNQQNNNAFFVYNHWIPACAGKTGWGVCLSLCTF